MDQDLRKPVQSLLLVDIGLSDYNKLKRYAKAFDEIIALGTHLLKWEIDGKKTREEGTEVVISLFRRALQVLDGASLLIENGSINPARALFRVVLELSMQFQYFLQDSAQIQTKTLHFTILEDYERLIELERDRKKTFFKKYWPSYDNEINYLKQAILSPIYDSVQPDFKNCIYTKQGQRRVRPAQWFSMSGGGNSYADLFQKLDRKEKHKEIYSLLSNFIHSAQTVRDAFYLDKEGKLRIRGIREYSQVHDVTIVLIGITLELYSWILQRRTYQEKQQYLINLEEWRNEYPDLYIGQVF